MQITFIADTLADLVAQLRHFIGEPAPAAPPQAPEPVRPLPAWAPAGARWQPMPGAPVLIGSDGQVIPVEWQPGGPMPGQVIVNHDPAAEAAGAALLAAMGGRQPTPRESA